MTLRIAAAQAEAVPGEVAANLRVAAGLVERAAEEGAHLLVLPEAFVTGYAAAALAGPLPGLDEVGWLDGVQRAVDRTGMVVVLNTALARGGGGRTLTDLLLSPGRPVLDAYDKQHLYDDERAVFSPGSRGASIVVRGVRVALSVCYDATFPEHAAAAAATGALVYVNSGAYFPGGAHRRDLHHAARALDNGMYVAFAGLLGAPSGFIGGAAVFGPLGEQVAAVPEVDGAVVEGLAVADVDPAVVERARSAQRMWADRRPGLGGHADLGALG